jgi:hypothetical protein
VLFPLSIVIDDKFTPQKAELSMNATLPGITIEWSDDYENGDDSSRVNRELDSNEMDESDRQFEKHNEQRTSVSFGIITCDDLEKLRLNLWQK